MGAWALASELQHIIIIIVALVIALQCNVQINIIRHSYFQFTIILSSCIDGLPTICVGSQEVKIDWEAD